MPRLIVFGAFMFTVTSAMATHAQTSARQPHVSMTFLSHRASYNQLYQSQPDGANEQAIFGGPITDLPSFDDSYKMYREPHWTRQSPNGKYFASWLYEMGIPHSKYKGSSRPMLVVGDLGGKWTRIVNSACHEEFAWSQDSKQLAFSVFSETNYNGVLQQLVDTTEIFVTGIDGSNYNCILEKKGKWIVLDWSPDGKRLLIENRRLGGKIEDSQSNLFEFRVIDAIDARRKSKYDPNWVTQKASDFLTPISLNLKDLQFSGARYSPTRSEIAIETFDPRNMYAPNLVGDDELSQGRMMRLLGKIHVFDTHTSALRKVADYDDGIRGPICWSPDGNDIYFSRYLPKDDDREKMSEDKEHGLSIWAVGRDGENARFVTTGWSPDFPRNVTIDGK
jgi:hypothetical protein